MVSIVIPCYNASKYLRQCLDSIKAQTYKDFEVLCIDDCSKDETYAILQEYHEKDSRFKIFRTKKNSGSARRPKDIGIYKAQRDLILFCDADDYLESDYVRKMLRRQSETEADVVLSRMLFFNDDNANKIIMQIPNTLFDMSQILTGREATKMTIGKWDIGANGMLVSKSLLLRQREKHPNLKHMNADEFDTREIFVMAKTISLVDAAYYYRKYSGSITSISIRQFEELHTNKMNLDLMLQTYGKTSEEYSMALDYYLSSVLFYTKKYSKDKDMLTYEENKIVSTIIKSHSRKISLRQIITSKIRRKSKVLLSLPFVILSILFSLR